jgi:hypothetical protein
LWLLNYNNAGEKAKFCKSTKSDMINVRSKKWVGCRLQSTIMQREKAQILWRHKTSGWSMLCWRLVSTRWCIQPIYNKAYEGYCLKCFMRYPHRTVSQELQGQRYAVVEYILEQFPGVDWIHDWRSFFDGCSNDYLTKGIWASKHWWPKSTSIQYLWLQLREQTVNGTFADFGHRPIVVIRFNGCVQN